MHILVINSGSSSIKFSVFEGANPSDSPPRNSGDPDPGLLFDGELSGVGSDQTRLRFEDANGKDVSGGRTTTKASTSSQAIHLVIDAVLSVQLPSADKIAAVGYRVVHPGPNLKAHTRITEEVLAELEKAAVFAPLHDPAVIAVIREGIARMPEAAHYACFDTVFHETMPETATTYPLPESVRECGVRRYGFHGLSCESIVRQMYAASERGELQFPNRMVIAHLGSGCSVTALVGGCSVDTSMGLTPTGGVVMGTRPGDLDPGVVLYLLREAEGDKAAAITSVEAMVNHDAGMKALSGLPNDMKTARQAAEKGDKQALLAIEVFTRSVRKAIGGYCWLLGGLDAIVFAGGIGEHDAASRKAILVGLDALGVTLNDARNKALGDGVRHVNADGSAIAVYVIPAAENLMIAIHVVAMAKC